MPLYIFQYFYARKVVVVGTTEELGGDDKLGDMEITTTLPGLTTTEAGVGP